MCKLVKATDLPASKVMEFRQAFLSVGECSINGSRGLHHYEKHEEWLWLVGCIELRHTLNEPLAVIGGHIGFSVIPEERRKGYATEMLKQVLAVAKKAGIDKVLLTCDIDNIASCKTVEKCGGKKEQEDAFVLDGEPYYKYWIIL